MNSLYTAEGVMDKHSLWQRYVPLVRHEALRLQVRLPASVELDDLLQAGGIGLLNAVERYDALQGTAFTTYAVQRIRGAMLDELRSRDWVPRSVRRNAREVAQAIGQLEQELGRNATETEVAERLGIDIADYRQMLLDTNNSQLFSYDEWREEHDRNVAGARKTGINPLLPGRAESQRDWRGAGGRGIAGQSVTQPGY